MRKLHPLARALRLIAIGMGGAGLVHALNASATARDAATPSLSAMEVLNPRFTAQSTLGGVGLLQTPTARMAPDGEFSFGYSESWPYNRGWISMQFLPWFEGTVRYTDVENRLYGPSIAGDQSYKDKSADFKFRLWQEDATTPEISLGLRDIGGTGLFGSEYIVANKRWYDLDFSLGMGWGYLGNRGHFKNPLGWLSERFKTRPASAEDFSDVGTAAYNTWFRGEEVALFGGVEWHTPLPGLRLQLEYDPNDYQHEWSNNNQPVDSPLNFGARYRAFDWLDIALGYERGNTVMAQFVIRSNFEKDKGLPKIFDKPAYEPITDDAARTRANNLSEAERQRMLARGIARNGLTLTRSQLSEDTWAIELSQGLYRNTPQAAGRAARYMTELAPDGVTVFSVADERGGLQTQQIEFFRHEFENALTYRGSPEEIWNHTKTHGGESLSDDAVTQTGKRAQDGLPDLVNGYPRTYWGVEPRLRQSIGGPDDFYLWQIWAEIYGGVELMRGLEIQGAVGLDIASNLDKFKYEPTTGTLPHVRSDLKEYLTEGRNNIPRLVVEKRGNLAEDIYARATIGLLEEMYGGVGGEILYRPHDQRWAVGAEVYAVRQRDYDQKFSFRDYETVTGHANLYYDLPWKNLQAKISAGRYLAEDLGMTFDLSRRFANGARFGAFATFTNVTSEQFGEGSFDKGIYIQLPLDLFNFRSVRSSASFAWRPLTRDGGQKIYNGMPLFEVLQDSHAGAISRDWSKILH